VSTLTFSQTKFKQIFTLKVTLREAQRLNSTHTCSVVVPGCTDYFFLTGHTPPSRRPVLEEVVNYRHKYPVEFNVSVYFTLKATAPHIWLNFATLFAQGRWRAPEMGKLSQHFDAVRESVGPRHCGAGDSCHPPRNREEGSGVSPLGHLPWSAPPTGGREAVAGSYPRE